MAPPSMVSAALMRMTTQPSPESFVNTGPRKPVAIMPSFASSTTAPALEGVLPRGPALEVQDQDESLKSKLRGKRFLFRNEIDLHKKDGDAWIVVDGKVYDVTNFLETHPGGPELILEHLHVGDTRDAGPLMKGKVDEDGHIHSKAAFRMLEQFLIGFVEGPLRPHKTETGKIYRHDVDLTKPIVAQVGFLGADYDEWVHDPIVCKEIPRFFESDIQEFFTRTSWRVIPIVWCPIAFLMLYLAVVKEGVPLRRMPGLMVVGVGIWTLVEYLLHRFLFHMKPSTFWGNTFHYVIHGFHHKFPMDGARLVFPPAFTSVVCVIIWLLWGRLFVSYPYKLVIYGSALLTYVAYDLTHYFLHFGTPFNEQTRRMKRYHLNHHFKNQSESYGITSTFWDRVFRTLPAAKPSKE